MPEDTKPTVWLLIYKPSGNYVYGAPPIVCATREVAERIAGDVEWEHVADYRWEAPHPRTPGGTWDLIEEPVHS